MQSEKHSNKRRQLLGTSLGLGVIGAALPSAWTKPMVNAVVLPAHAGMSPMCPIIIVDNVELSPASGGQNQCQIRFSILSSDAPGTELNDVVVTSDVVAPDMLTTDGETTTPVVVTWIGGGLCSGGTEVELFAEVAVSITASCTASPDPVTFDLNLSSLANVSVVTGA